MQRVFFLFLFVVSFFCAAAQKTKLPVYFYTNPSEKYFTDGEIDSLLYNTSAIVFKENMIPKELFEKKYPVVKSLLATMGRNNFVQSFKAIEVQLGKKINAQKGTQQFSDNKKIYTEGLVKEIRKTFAENKMLSQYLFFNNSDRITYFNSTVRIGTDGKLIVTEKISISNGNGQPNPIYGRDSSLIQAGAMNNEIKRGIVRAFPLYYINKYKLFQNTTFKLKEVLKDGKKGDYHTEKKDNGILVFTGSSNIFLDPGNYNYSITYETEHQLKFLKDFDELYWNVTGNSWSFRIDSAKCTVILPKGATALSNKCYTGLQGVANEDCNITTQTIGDSTVIVFKTTKPLMPNQGLTVATSWPKGFVSSPGKWQQLKYFIWNNRAVFLLPIAALFSILFCFIFWVRYGRDPKRGVAYPLFEPPAGYSPAAMGYIYYQKFDRQFTAATIVDAAVRNKIKIDVEREGKIFKHNEYKISGSDKVAKPPVSNYEDFGSDVEDLINTRIEKGKYNSDLGSLNTAIKKYCEDNYKNKDGVVKKGYKGFFALNTSYTGLPGFICMVAVVWGLIEAVGAGIHKNYWQYGYWFAGILLCLLVFKFFGRLLKAYSPEGRKLADRIEGFRMFLSTADEQRFNTMNPPKKSLELYEKYLPFAIALGCEIEWGKKFEDIINTAYLGGTAAYSFSRSLSHDDKSFSSSFASSFTGAISSASSPPSSSSGGGSSFGGGSSGGGGGGGGGGGW